MASALSSLAKALDRPAEVIPADPTTLRPLLAGLTPAMVGHRPGRWRNILSLVTAAFARAGIVAIQGRIREAPSAAWCAVLALPKAGAHRHFNLWRLARYCSQNGIEPATVDDAVIATYRQDLTARSLVTEPDRAARDAARYWNMAAAAHLEWPQQRLTVPDNRDIYSLSWDRYPASLRQEIEAWCKSLADDTPFKKAGFRPLRPRSVHTRRSHLCLFLGALVRQGVEPAALVDLRTAVTPAMAELGLRYIYERAGKKFTQHTFQIAGVVQMIAKHWAKLPVPEVQELRQMVKQCRPKGMGMSERTKARVRAVAEYPDRLNHLLLLPDILIEEARRAGPPNEQSAQQVQTAIALQVLLFVPVRLENLRGIRMGVHLLQGPGKRLSISLDGSETKNGEPYHAALPLEVARHIEVYLERHRPLLLPGPCDWLFPGMFVDHAKTGDALRTQLRKAIAMRCGVILTPHCFRALAGWMVLKKDPRAHGMVQRILGHKSLVTTQSYYTGLEQSLAVESYDALLLEERRKAAAPAALRRRRVAGGSP